MVERPSPGDRQAVALEVLKAHEILRHLAHRVRRQRAKLIGLSDRDLVRVHQPVLLAGADDKEPRRTVQLPDALEEIDLAARVSGEDLGRRVSRAAHKALCH